LVAVTVLVAVPTLAGPAGAAGSSPRGVSELSGRVAANHRLAANIETKKPKRKKKMAKGLAATLRHDAAELIVVAAAVYALFLIGSGVRGPRGRKRHRARATARSR
jgi:hypothetical protein